MRNLSLLAAVIMGGGVAAAVGQDPGLGVPPPCQAELAWVTEFAATNYSGFETKTAGDRLDAYRELVRQLETEAALAGTAAKCDVVLRRWAGFFQDGHLSLGRWGPATADPLAATAAPPTDGEIRARFADWPSRTLTEADARAALGALGGRQNPVEGIWESSDAAYRAVVLRSDEVPGRYIMSILRADSVWWLPGQVKAIFEASGAAAYDIRFFMRDHSEQAWTGTVDRNVLVMGQGSTWFRVYPALPGDVARDVYLDSYNRRFAARSAAPGTVVLHLPSFDDPVRMDSLLDAETDRIRDAELLLIDVRGNGGGSDYNFRALVPLLYTAPIRIVSNEVLATPANIAANAALAADTTIPAGIREQLGRQVEDMKAAEGGWFPFPDRTHELPEVLERPTRVAVLVDGRCASSCEQFLLMARQSRKVTIYGEPTAGILDFGNVRSATMPGGTLRLFYPTTRSKRLPHAPVDGVGVLPDVLVPDGQADPVAWVLDRFADAGA
jgi:hypothetical protein